MRLLPPTTNGMDYVRLHRRSRHAASTISPSLVLLALASSASLPWSVVGVDGVEYGVDVSYPIHHANVSTNYAWLPHNLDPTLLIPPEYLHMPIQPLGDMQKKHDDFMAGCVQTYDAAKGTNRCWQNERERIDMSLRQPQSMNNYTALGYAKIRTPAFAYQLLKEFYDNNQARAKPERWPTANVYTNHWDSPTYMISVEDTDMLGGGYVLKQHLWNAFRDTMEAWTGHRMVECSLYGIRVYKEHSILATHVDRLPLVSSAIINVDQDVDEPWPLEVIGHDGKAVNVTMEPGDMVLYESHSILHGRPFPLKGRFFANVFVHFEPIGPVNGPDQYTGDLPPYVIPGSLEEDVWRRKNPSGHKVMKRQEFTTGSTEAHRHAVGGDVEQLREILDKQQEIINVRDANGWTPLHEAIRKGSYEPVKLLLDRGAEVNARVGRNGDGASALSLAIEYLGHDSEIASLLRERGGVVNIMQQEL